MSGAKKNILSPAAPRRQPALEAPADGKIRVLLVDDHAIVRRGLTLLINAEKDMQICGEADSARAALTLIERTQPHIILVDISLKEGDGLELIKLTTAHHPSILSLVLSMYNENVYAERALRSGARGYVRKAEAAETMMTAIRKVLAGEVYISENATASLLRRISGARQSVRPFPVEKLSDRELQVLRCIGRGLSNREIAEELFITIKTVESHREHIKTKLELSSSGELLRYAIEFNRVIN